MRIFRASFMAVSIELEFWWCLGSSSLVGLAPGIVQVSTGKLLHSTDYKHQMIITHYYIECPKKYFSDHPPMQLATRRPKQINSWLFLWPTMEHGPHAGCPAKHTSETLLSKLRRIMKNDDPSFLQFPCFWKEVWKQAQLIAGCFKHLYLGDVQAFRLIPKYHRIPPAIQAGNGKSSQDAQKSKIYSSPWT